MSINLEKIFEVVGNNSTQLKVITYITTMAYEDPDFNGVVYLKTGKLAKVLQCDREHIRQAKNSLVAANILIPSPFGRDMFAVNRNYINLQHRLNDITCNDIFKKPTNKFVEVTPIGNLSNVTKISDPTFKLEKELLPF